MGELAADAEHNSILHFSHDDHKLIWKTEPVQFECNGCQEIGWGASFRCETCKFHLHDVCAKHAVSISFPFLKGPELEFIWDTFGHKSCTACGRAVKGCGYHQRKENGYSLHPLCAKLPDEIPDVNDDLYGQRFNLHHKLKSKCCLCGSWKPQGGVGKLTGWSYRSTCKMYSIHISCAKEIVVKMCEMMESTVENSGSKEISLAPNLIMVSERSGENSSSKEISEAPNLKMISEGSKENSFTKEISLASTLKMVYERSGENRSSKEISEAPNLKMISEGNKENSFSKEISVAPNLKLISERSGTSSRERKIRFFCKVGKLVLRFSINILIAILVGVPTDGIISLIGPII